MLSMDVVVVTLSRQVSLSALTHEQQRIEHVTGDRRIPQLSVHALLIAELRWF